MEHTHTAAEPETAHADSTTKAIWKTFWILLCITIVEVGFAFLHLEYAFLPRVALNAFFVLATFLKAFFIVAEFMHLGHEIKNLVMTVLIPLLLFVWFIIAFLYEGNSWKNMRKDLKPGTPVETPKVAPAEKPGHY
ncbi:cytochrome C oxidase subunit IV family protein [Chitinophaga sp. 30R24]|uniref:cytochrome C oxidase subunit IV family protein n=1 Tax=Chitinophaga sp. 30R24 TaxID=3248838 RepID=UPI003B914D2F